MEPHSRLGVTLALVLPVLLIFSLLVFVVLTQPDDQCAPAELAMGVPTASTMPTPATTNPSASATSAGPASSGKPLPATLSVPVNGQMVKLDAAQIKVAATAIAEGKALGIPERGWIVAIAAAGAESGIRNLAGGDRDSVGPWQMRPSTGWGTVAQIRNVSLAARAFYGKAKHTNNPGLTDVDGWEHMTIAQAAQAVERSAFPNAYTKWEAAARSLVEQLAGVDASTDGAGVNCQDSAGLDGDCPVTNLPAEAVLTPDALLVLRCVKQAFPDIEAIGTYKGHQPDASRAVDIMIPNWDSQPGKTLGTQIAAWIKTHAKELGVQYVIWDQKIWNTERNGEGWRLMEDRGSSTENHQDHVHVSVYGNKGTGPAGSSGPAIAGAWHSPVGRPSRVGCGFGCYSGHTGQDYPAAPGVPVYAVQSGTVIRSESITSSGNCSTLPICGGTRISYGNLLVIQLASGDHATAWYAHLSERRVKKGDTVKAGQVIGTVGFQGHVLPPGPAGSHLHFEIRRSGTPINPLPYLRTKGIRT